MSAFEHRGIVEGYYGRAYSAEERMAWIRDLGRWGMNRYLYAPKDDPLHREHWREPYPSEAMDAFEALVREGDEHGVRVGFAISPGLSIHYANRDDHDRLIEKFRSFHALGSRFFSLALDDVPTALRHDDDRASFSSLARAHVALAHSVKASLPGDAIFWLIPTDYIGVEASEYLEELGQSLDPEIEVGWTGRTVMSPEIGNREARERSQTLGRKLLVWDNFPVNDGPMRPMLNLGPYTGRDARLAEHVSGVLLNPMELARASRLSVRTAADYLDDPDGYDPERSWMHAAQELGAGAPEAFTRFARAHRFSTLSPRDRDLELEAAFESVRALHAAGRGAATALGELDAMLDLRSHATDRLRDALEDRDLATELEPWFASYETECQRMRIAVDLLIALESGEDGSPKLDAMDLFFAFSRFEGRLTHVPGPIKASFGPRRVLYAQLRSLEDDAARFGADPALFLDQCLSDAFVRHAETRASERLGAKVFR